MNEEIQMALDEAREKMDKAIEVAREDFGTIRTGRANANMFNKIVVDYYGTATPLNQLASFQVPEARMIVISPYDKGAMAEIEKALRDSDLGVNPNTDGAIIRIVLPELTEERRKEFCKLASKYAEEGKVALRNLRRDAIDKIKKQEKEGDFSEDQSRDEQDSVQKTLDKFISELEKHLADKEADILKV